MLAGGESPLQFDVAELIDGTCLPQDASVVCLGEEFHQMPCLRSKAADHWCPTGFSDRAAISIVLPEPGSPKTTSRPVGTHVRIVASSLPSPARSSWLSAQAAPGGREGHPAPVWANSFSDSRLSANTGSAADHETGSGYGSFKRRIWASSCHCPPTDVAS